MFSYPSYTCVRCGKFKEYEPGTAVNVEVDSDRVKYTLLGMRLCDDCTNRLLKINGLKG